MQVIHRYCDVCGVEMNHSGSLAYETALTLTTPFKVLRWGREEAVTSSFPVCRGCNSTITTALEVAADQYKDAWLSVVNTHGLGKPFKKETLR